MWIYNYFLKETNYRLLHYSGNTDAAVGTAGTKRWIKNQGYTVTASEREWKVDDKFVGHITEYGNFVFATVNGTGHMAP